MAGVITQSLILTLAVSAAWANLDSSQDPIPGCAEFEKDWDLPGGDYSVSPHNDTGCVADSNCPCQKQCETDPKCHAWTLVPGKKCCLKGKVPTPRQKTGSGFFSGVKTQYKASCKGPAPPAPLPPAPPHVGPLACQDNEQQPMLPIYHIIGNVTQNRDGSIKLEAINDCSGVTYYEGLWHVWHQCCQNHWDHIVSKDLIHWQRLPPPIQPLSTKTWDGSISMLPAKDGGPLILYDAQDGKQLGAEVGDRPILGVARLADPKDKYLMKWVRDASNPVKFNGDPIAFPGQVWKNGDHWNFIGQGQRFQSNDSSFHTWDNMGKMVGLGEHGGQWWIPVPNQVDGSPPPAGVPNRLVNVGGGDLYLFGDYHANNETFVPWSPNGEKPGKEAHLEGGKGGWWGGQMANDRMMVIGWALPDFHGPAGPGIGFLTRLTLLREVNYDAKIQNLVSNPVPELKGLRTGSLASEKAVALKPNVIHAIKGTAGGAAASADIELTFSGITQGSDAVFGACVLANSTFEGLGIHMEVTNGTAGRTAKVVVGSCSSASVQGKPTEMPLFDEDKVAVRITPDRSLADFFVQGGRWSGTVAWLSKTPRAAGDSLVTVWSTTAGVTADIDVYGMGCGWVNPSYTDSPSLFDEEISI